MTNDRLAIAIPTYNRHQILRENLELMLPEIIEHGIKVYISDDSSDDLTKEMVSELMRIYPNIEYTRNEHRLGHDRNCISTLGKPGQTYVWYLGDSQIICPGGIKRVLEVIGEKPYDFIAVNSLHRCISTPSKVYTDANEFFVDLAWHTTLTGATIYRTGKLFTKDYDRYLGSNFMQLGILLQELLDSSTGICWLNENLIYGNEKKGGSYWNSQVFKVFAEDWVDFIYSLPEGYTHDNKVKVMKSHSDNTGLFNERSYLAYRLSDRLDLKSYYKYYGKLKYATSLDIFDVFKIAITPKLLVKRRFEKTYGKFIP
ncbi:glycosyltransferase family 2 protein [Youngiibacter fragilis]|uniref:Glycosyltransferase 2-like domain-containing protein n=1 Tax=Youngiibacter fragilis 232.1 TaxID=994573 RepID=V7I3B3_9CLOT|nr:glycosyltransferase [Youngiibacter fragilis]ETA80735.1 hypothetical protein T472_0210240 [Youngiibacter fragilis 232.1]